MWRWILAGFVGLGCQSNDDSPSTSLVSETPKETTVVRADEAPKPMKARLEREILVGGCRELCEEPRDSIVEFLQRSASGDALGVVPFLETSEMLFNGKHLGKGWVERWRSGALEERKKSIASFADRIVKWGQRVESVDLQASLANNLVQSEDDGPGFLFYFRPPAGAALPNELKEWKFRVQRRGWEWLISEITFHAE